jgi:hypothetical protein
LLELSNMETKTSKAVKLFKDGHLKEALSLFSKFRSGFTKKEKRTLEIAYESSTGKDTYYKSLGIDTDKQIVSAISIIKRKYIDK